MWGGRTHRGGIAIRSYISIRRPNAALPLRKRLSPAPWAHMPYGFHIQPASLYPCYRLSPCGTCSLRAGANACHAPATLYRTRW